MTPFLKIYNAFFRKITDDMYMEWTEEETRRDCESMLLDAVPNFEFPRKSLSYEGTNFTAELDDEEINILAQLMVLSWLGRQLASVEVTRQKYSGNDFKFTSQASHLARLINLKDNFYASDRHLQRLYKRRKREDGTISSNWSTALKGSALD